MNVTMIPSMNYRTVCTSYIGIGTMTQKGIENKRKFVSLRQRNSLSVAIAGRQADERGITVFRMVFEVLALVPKCCRGRAHEGTEGTHTEQ